MNPRTCTFTAMDGTRLSGWLRLPDPPGPHPLIVLTHGLSGLIDLGLAGYADRFARAGFACLVYDHRNWGRSDGMPRHETNPWQQVSDMRDAITYGASLPEIAGDRIGLWGTSFSGGHVMVVAATDTRVACVVSQVPFVSGVENFPLWVPDAAAFQAAVVSDRRQRADGAPPLMQPVASKGDETWEWVRRVDEQHLYPNELTLQSLDMIRTYEPGTFASRIRGVPLMMVIAGHDNTTRPEWQTTVFDEVPQPKELVRIDCGHYDVYTTHLDTAAANAVRWFRRYLAIG